MKHIIAAAGIFAVASAKTCHNMTIPVQIEARQGVFNIPTLNTDVDVVQFVQNFTNIKYGMNYTAAITTGYQTVNAVYNISAKFCTPDSGAGNSPAIQVLTHGIGFDKTYWDLPYNNFNYSYENIATSAGYCTLAIDRFGIGNSSHADPYQIVQAPAQVSVLHQLNLMLRSGTLPGVNYTFGPGKIVNVGHSFGSQQSYQLATMFPNSTDAIILTGFSLNNSFVSLPSFDAKLARLNQPLRFGSPDLKALTTILTSPSINSTLSTLTSIATAAGLSPTSSNLTDLLTTTNLLDLISGLPLTTPLTTSSIPPPLNYPPGYLTWSSLTANIYNFLYATPTTMDLSLLPILESTKQPFTPAEILTLGGKPQISPFTGPVHILTGRQDAIYCGGDCLVTGVPSTSSIPAAAGMYFPQSSNFTTSIPEGVGHSITVHYGSQEAYRGVQTFLKGEGIMSQ